MQPVTDTTGAAETNRALKSLGEFTVSRLITMVFKLSLRLLKTAALMRLLGPAGRGIYGVLVTISLLVVSFGNLGFGLGSVYVISDRKYELRKVIGNAFLYILVQGMILMGVVLVLSHFGEFVFRENRQIVEQFKVFLFAAVFLMLFEGLTRSLLTGIKDIHFVNLRQVSFSILTVFLLLVLWHVTGNGVQSALVAWVTTSAFLAVCTLIRLWRKAGGRLGMSLPYMKEAFFFGIRGNLSMVANTAVRRIDLLFIAHYLGVKAVGYYAASVSIAEILLMVSESASGPFLPLRLELGKKTGRHFSSLIVKYVLIVMALVCGLTALLGQVIIRLLYGASYLPAFGPLLWLLPGILALSIYHFLKADIYSLNRPGFVSWISVLALVCNLILNVMMIPRYGINGAAISSSISYLLSTLILLAFFFHKTGLSPRDFLLPRIKDLGFLVQTLKSYKLSDVARKEGAKSGVGNNGPGCLDGE